MDDLSAAERWGESSEWPSAAAAPCLLMWCNCLLLSGVILSVCVQAECQGDYE